MKQFYFIILSTFVIGMCAGAYIYIASRDEDPLFDFSDNETQSFEIIAHTYGGCMSTGECASYRIDEAGAYTYLVPSRDGEPFRSTGTFTREDLLKLKQLVRDTDLEGLQNSEFIGDCPILYDALGFTYALQTDEENYVFDSCEQALDGEPLFNMLAEYFNTLAREVR